MKFAILYLIVVIVVSVSGQFYETELNVGSVPLNLRRIIAYEIQPTVAQLTLDEGTRSINQGRRHVENRRNIASGQNQNENSFEIQAENYIRNNNRQDSTRKIINQNVYSEQIDNTRRNTENRVTLNQDANIQQYIPLNNNGRSDKNTPVEQNYSEQRRGNQQHTNNRQATESMNLNRNSHIASNIKTSTTRAIITENSQNNFNGNENTESKSGVYKNANEGTQNTHPTDSDGNRHSEDITGFQKVTNDGSGKTGQDNEHSASKSRGDKWVSNDSSEIKTKSTVEPTVPTVDDRASFLVEKCPDKQVRFNGICVDPD